MISHRTETLEKDVNLLEDVKITHVSLVDKPANRRALAMVKRNDMRKMHIALDGSSKGSDSGEEIDKTEGVTENGRWVRTKTGQRYFIPAGGRPRTRDVSGGHSVPRQNRNVPSKPRLVLTH